MTATQRPPNAFGFSRPTLQARAHAAAEADARHRRARSERALKAERDLAIPYIDQILDERLRPEELQPRLRQDDEFREHGWMFFEVDGLEFRYRRIRTDNSTLQELTLLRPHLAPVVIRSLVDLARYIEEEPGA